jgi:hypothetical protein
MQVRGYVLQIRQKMSSKDIIFIYIFVAYLWNLSVVHILRISLQDILEDILAGYP